MAVTMSGRSVPSGIGPAEAILEIEHPPRLVFLARHVHLEVRAA